MGNTKINMMQMDGDGNVPVTLGTDTVDTAEIVTGAVEADEIATGAVDTAEILDGAVVNADVNAAAALAFSKLAALTDGSILVGSAATVPTVKALSGDVTMVNTGAVTIGADKVTNDMQKVPKLVVYQETCPVASFDDSGGSAVGFLDLSTTIPAGSQVLKCLVHGIVGFAGDTTATVQVGDGSTADRYSTGTPNVFATATAGVAMGAVSGTAFHAAVKTPRVTITGTSDFTSIVSDGNGTCVITIFYYRPV